MRACIIDYPPFGPSPFQPTYPQPLYYPPLRPEPVVPAHTHYHFTPNATPALSDADVDRIARRLAEILKEPTHGS